MQTNLAKRLGTRNVNVKGKSPEGIGSLGQEAGIAAQAVAMIEKTAPPPLRGTSP
jgi:2C-methyl-D-erythritol 2,4-cyclodiphosphate synthase